MQIDKSVPVPACVGPGRPFVYPWPEMQVGDSIFFAGETSQGNAAQAARHYAKERGLRFISRSVDGGVRIWRIA